MQTSAFLSIRCIGLVMLVFHLQNLNAKNNCWQSSLTSRLDTILPVIMQNERDLSIHIDDYSFPTHLQFDLSLTQRDSSGRGRKDSNRTFMPMKTGLLYLKSAGKVGLIHAVSLACLFSSSKEVTNWEYDFSPELFRHTGENLKKAWTSLPRWDDDPFKTNYVQHPYAGSFYYNLVRNKGASWKTSFAFSLISSTAFEYFTEAMFERPSTQDLFVTPVIGSLLGEATHQLTFAMAHNGFNVIERVIVLFINPAYVLNHGFKVPSEERRRQMMRTRRGG